MLKSINLKVMDDTWSFSIWDNEAFCDTFGKQNAAMTFPEKLEVHFCEEDFDVKTILHELFHVQCKYLYLESATISVGQLEEIHAEMFSDRLDKLNSLAKTIYKKLKI